MNTEPKSAKSSPFQRLPLNKSGSLATLLILAFVLLRFLVFYDYKPLWIDEQISVNAACGDSSLNAYSFEELQQIRSENLKSPGFLSKVFYANLQNDRSNALLYDYALSAWVHCFGLSLFSVRALSLLCFILVLLAARAIASELQITSSFYLVLLLSSSLLYRYNMEARTYLFTLCLSLWSTLLLLRYLREGQLTTLLGYLFLVLLSVFSHYLVVVVFAWHGILVLKTSKKEIKFKLLGGYLILLLVFFTLLYWLDQYTGFIQQLAQANANITQNAPASIHFKPFSLPNLVSGLVQVLSQNFGLSLQSLLQIRYFAILLLIPVYFIYTTYKSNTRPNTLVFVVLIGVHLVFLTSVSALSANTTIFQLCYSIFVLPYYLLYFAQLSTSNRLKPYEQILKWSVVLFSLIDTAGYIYLA
ncbi:MAG: glycosyltransferase family 39 protein [Bacteroidia bacterium]|nr:glycosyltransferase family 39 protein [Bacteroidia bacterium]